VEYILYGWIQPSNPQKGSPSLLVPAHLVLLLVLILPHMSLLPINSNIPPIVPPGQVREHLWEQGASGFGRVA
jgi:hypothetical protein